MRDLVSGSNDAAIVRAIVAIAKSLGLERQAQPSMLQECGCELFQGYLFSRPMPAGRLRQVVRLERPLRAPRVAPGCAPPGPRWRLAAAVPAGPWGGPRPNPPPCPAPGGRTRGRGRVRKHR